MILSPCTSLYNFTWNVFELLDGCTLVILQIYLQSWIKCTEGPSLSPSTFIPRIPSPIISAALYLPTKAKDSYKHIQQATSCSTPHYFLCAMKSSLSWFYTTNLIKIYLLSVSFFTVCKIFSHYTRCLKIESISCLRHLQYKLTHCKDYCWVFLNHMAFTTSAKRQTSMHWHCLSICLLYCHDSSEPNLDANFLLTICMQESSQASWWLGASQDRADANLW